jgi:hypothetical protein
MYYWILSLLFFVHLTLTKYEGTLSSIRTYARKARPATEGTAFMPPMTDIVIRSILSRLSRRAWAILCPDKDGAGRGKPSIPSGKPSINQLVCLMLILDRSVTRRPINPAEWLGLDNQAGLGQRTVWQL